MRLAYLTGRYPEISHTFILREVQALRARGLDVHTFSIWRTDSAQLLAPEDREEAARTFSVLPLRPLRVAAAHATALGRSPAACLATLRAAVRLGVPGVRGRLLALLWYVEAITLWRAIARRRIRHVHAHLNGTAPAVALLIARFGRATGEPWTWSMTVHGPTEFYDVARERLPEKVREATFVVAISDFARSQLLGLVEPEHHPKIHVVHCGIDPAVFNGTPRPSGDGTRPLEVLCVSRLTLVKGHTVLLHALARLRRDGVPFRATVIGDGPTRAALDRLAAELGIANQVRFTGAVGQHVIREYYAEADVFCLTSFAEGVPIVLMEAMAMRIPVVASGVMGVGELVRHRESGILVRPGRPDLVAAALRRLYASPELRARLGAAGRDVVRREFDVETSAGRLAELFSAYVPG